jgi:chemotaxis protein methyltransferase CheR
VLIYFDRPTQSHIVGRFAPLLAPGGLLFAGHSENLAYARQFRPRGHTVYALAAQEAAA